MRRRSHTVRFRGAATCLGAVLGLFAFSLPALAQPTIALTPDRGPVGSEFSVEGQGFQSAELVDIVWDDQHVIGSSTADTTGAIVISLVVPPAGNGRHTVTARATSGDLSTKFVVVPSAAAVTTTTTAPTTTTTTTTTTAPTTTTSTAPTTTTTTAPTTTTTTAPTTTTTAATTTTASTTTTTTQPSTSTTTAPTTTSTTTTPPTSTTTTPSTSTTTSTPTTIQSTSTTPPTSTTTPSTTSAADTTDTTAGPAPETTSAGESPDTTGSPNTRTDTSATSTTGSGSSADEGGERGSSESTTAHPPNGDGASPEPEGGEPELSVERFFVRPEEGPAGARIALLIEFNRSPPPSTMRVTLGGRSLGDHVRVDRASMSIRRIVPDVPPAIYEVALVEDGRTLARTEFTVLEATSAGTSSPTSGPLLFLGLVAAALGVGWQTALRPRAGSRSSLGPLDAVYAWLSRRRPFQRGPSG